MAIKMALGKLTFRGSLPATLGRAERTLALTRLPITHEHALRVRDLPPHHKDPFDRMLVAQAQAEALTLVTSDRLLRRYDVPILW
jgi:PIN domain nuclease of toxin-antitoxin system